MRRGHQSTAALPSVAAAVKARQAQTPAAVWAHTDPNRKVFSSTIKGAAAGGCIANVPVGCMADRV